MKQVVLAKVSKAVFHFDAWPGDVLTYRAEVHDINKDGAMATVTSHVDEKLQAELEVFFAHLEQHDEQGRLLELFDPYDLFSWLRLLKLYEVGRDAEGNPLKIHPNMAACDPHLSSQPTAAV